MMRGTTPRYQSAFRHWPALKSSSTTNAPSVIVRNVASKRNTAEPFDAQSWAADEAATRDRPELKIEMRAEQ
jgi:hypothetical protein